MKHTMRILSVFLVLMLCLSMLPVGALALELDLSVLESAAAAVASAAEESPALEETEDVADVSDEEEPEEVTEENVEAESAPATEPVFAEGISVENEAPAVEAGIGVAIDEINFPDVRFRTLVSEQYDKDGDGHLSEAEIEDVYVMDLSNKAISSLKGIEWFTNVWHISCSGNSLTELDVSALEKLSDLECSDNELTALDVSKNTELRWLSCSNNALTELDVSKNTKLENLYCGNNQIEKLDLSENQKLTHLGCANNGLTELSVTKATALETLDCGGNKLTELDVTENIWLEQLDCSENELTALDISQCVGLYDLECDANELTYLNLTGCEKLHDVVINGKCYVNNWGTENHTVRYYGDSAEVTCDTTVGIYSDGVLLNRDVVGDSYAPPAPGDVNGSGKLDVADVVSLAKQLLNDSSGPAGDLNDDGATDVQDLIRLIRYLAGESVTLN